MLRSDIERLDEATAAASRVTLAYQSPELPAATAAVPLETLAWQNAIEQLLELIAPDRPDPPALPPEGLLQAVFGASEVPPPGPLPGPSDLAPAPDYVIQSLSGETQPVLSLDEKDLFGDSGEPSIDLLTTGSSGPSTRFQGMEGDLFGSGQGVAPISISKNEDPPLSVKPAEEPEPLPDNDGYISLLGQPLEIELTVEGARALANEHGELFVDGDGDDLVRLSGDWIYAGERSEKGAEYYTDASGTLELTLHNAEAVLV